MKTANQTARETKNKTANKRSIGITALLSVTIAGLVLLSAGLVLALSMKTAWRGTSELLSAQAELAMTLMEEEVRNHISPALEISKFIHSQVAAGQIYPGNPKELLAVFRGALAAAPQIAGVVLWDKQYNRMEIRRSESGEVSVSAEPEPVNTVLYEFIERIRQSDAPRWGPPTEGDTEYNYVYAYAPLDYRGRHWGAMVTGVTINNLSAIVKRIGDSLDMTAFIIYDDLMLAHSALVDLPVVRDDDGFARLRAIGEVGDPVLAQFHDSEVLTDWEWEDGLETRQIRSPADGLDYWVLSRTNREYGNLPWHIGVYGAADTLDEYFDRLFVALLAGVGVLLLAIGCALWLARKISWPIRQLASSAERISMLELGRVDAIARSGIREIDEQAGAFNRMVDGLKWFETYVPKRLVRQLIRNRDAAASQEIELSVMFTDIIGFTSLSESMQPGEVGELVNAHFEIIARCIEAHGGTLDKYIGDAVMAFWGAPEAQPDHAQRACRAALAIADELARAQPATAAGAPAVRIKIALHSGALLVGNIGASSRMNYTVIGDTVNTCSRIESLCAQFDDGAPAVILVSSDTAELAQADPRLHFEEVGGYEVKGRSGEVHVCRLRWRDAPARG